MPGELSEEEKKKRQEEFNKKWHGDQRDAEAMQRGFQNSGVDSAKKAWEGIADLFIGKAQAKKRRD